MEKVLNDNSSHIAHKLLSRCHSPETTDRLFKERVVERPLLLRPTEATDARTERRQRREEKVAAQRRKSRKPKPLSAKEKRALCIYDIPKEHQRYTIYEPLHEMWCSYMREVLGIKPESNDTRDCSKSQRVHVTVQAAGPKIVSADFHGAVIEVVRSRCVSRVGLRGIVVKDTKFTFEIITPTNKLKSWSTQLREWH